MYIQKVVREDVAVLAVSGVPISRPDVASLHIHIGSLVEAGIIRVVVDCSGVKWFGAAMLGALVSGREALRNAGGDLRLAGVSGRARGIMATTNLDGIFPALDTVDRAVDSFRRQSVKVLAA